MKFGIVVTTASLSERSDHIEISEYNGRSALGYLVDKLARLAPGIPVVLLTSNNSADDVFSVFCKRWGIECFRGSSINLAELFDDFLDHYEWDYVVRVKSNHIFFEPKTLCEMLVLARTNNYHLISNVQDNTLPTGMNIEVIRSEYYRQSFKTATDHSAPDQFTSWLYNRPDSAGYFLHRNASCPDAAGLKLEITSEEDLQIMDSIMNNSNYTSLDFDLKNIYQLLTSGAKNNIWQGSNGPLLIAEIGGNHEGSFELAIKMTELAISSGSDCVKFQLYRGGSLVSPVESPDRYHHFKKFELSREQHVYLAEMCRSSNVIYAASVWDLEMLDWIDPYLDFYKVGSGDLTAWPLLHNFAQRGKPILLSTGLATLDEVLQTVRFIQKVNADYKDPRMLCIMQCTSMYPIPDKDANLKAMDTLKINTGLTVGYSDHTIGSEALCVAAAMGAKVLEFHFTDKREGRDFRDHKVSLIPEEVVALSNEIKRIITFQGNMKKTPQPSELDSNHKVTFRRGVYLRSQLKKGDTICEDDLIFLRPAIGTDARDSDLLLGAKVLRDLEPFSSLKSGLDYLPK